MHTIQQRGVKEKETKRATIKEEKATIKEVNQKEAEVITITGNIQKTPSIVHPGHARLLDHVHHHAHTHRLNCHAAVRMAPQDNHIIDSGW